MAKTKTKPKVEKQSATVQANDSQKTTSKSSDAGFTFSRVWAGRKDLVWIVAQKDPSTEPNYILQLKQGKWVYLTLQWPVIALTAVVKPETEVIALGPDGQVLRGCPTGFSNEHVDSSPKGPAAYGWMRDARFIDGKVVAVGMSRQVYLREARNRWRHMDEGVLAKPKDMAGFDSIDGFGGNDIYAVGLKGEIWHYDGKSWRKLDSPTTLALHRVRCVAPGTVYACGAGGALVQGTAGNFRNLESGVSDNLYGLEWFNGKLYAASQKALYALKGDKLQPVNVGIAGATFGDLHAQDGVLWSVGAKHILCTENGVKWKDERYIHKAV